MEIMVSGNVPIETHLGRGDLVDVPGEETDDAIMAASGQLAILQCCNSPHAARVVDALHEVLMPGTGGHEPSETHQRGASIAFDMSM